MVDFKKKIFGKNAIKLTFLGYSKKYSKNKFGNMKVISLSLCCIQLKPTNGENKKNTRKDKQYF